MQRQTESSDLYKALVEALSDNVLPTASIGLILLGSGLYTYSQTNAAVALALTVFGSVASVLKVFLIFFHRRTMRVQSPTLWVIRRFEVGHAIATWCMAAPIGALSALMFSWPELHLHVLGTALLFGYCAGVVTRISVRPVIAIGAVTLAAAPAITSALMFTQDARILIAAVFVLFFLNAVETISHLHRNASRLIAMRLKVANLARLDPLTSLRNRLGLQEAFNALPPNRSGAIAVHVFDLDGFKSVNDQFGHATGDRLLQALSERLRRVVGQNGVVARVGGDEFVVLQTGLDSESGSDLMASNIHRELTEPYEVGTGQPVHIGLSLGFSIADDSGASLDTLVREADAASYDVKRSGGGFRPHRSRQSGLRIAQKSGQERHKPDVLTSEGRLAVQGP